MKTTLTAKTPHGTFTRSTNTKYTYVVVRKSAKAEAVYAKKLAGEKVSKCGVDAKWAKDSGFVVTWHGNRAAAEKAAAAKYCYDWSALVLGVYAVEPLKPLEPQEAKRIFLDLSGKVIIK